MAAVVDLTGQRFGRWQVIEKVDNNQHAGTGAMWLCECDCGTRRVIASNPLRRGKSKSCGCYRHTRQPKFKPKAMRLLLFGGVPEVEPGSECEEHGCAEPSVSVHVPRCARHELDSVLRWVRNTSASRRENAHRIR